MINMDLIQEKLNTTRHPLVKGNVRTARNVEGELNLNTAGYTLKFCYKLKKFITPIIISKIAKKISNY
jgi:hypothetical protein